MRVLLLGREGWMDGWRSRHQCCDTTATSFLCFFTMLLFFSLRADGRVCYFLLCGFLCEQSR